MLQLTSSCLISGLPQQLPHHLRQVRSCRAMSKTCADTHDLLLCPWPVPTSPSPPAGMPPAASLPLPGLRWLEFRDFPGLCWETFHPLLRWLHLFPVWLMSGFLPLLTIFSSLIPHVTTRCLLWHPSLCQGSYWSILWIILMQS